MTDKKGKMQKTGRKMMPFGQIRELEIRSDTVRYAMTKYRGWSRWSVAKTHRVDSIMQKMIDDGTIKEKRIIGECESWIHVEPTLITPHPDPFTFTFARKITPETYRRTAMVV